MATRDDLYLDIMVQIKGVLRRLRIESNFEDSNFLPGRGESVYSTFLRVIGFLSYPENIEQQIGIEKRIENGRSLVGRILKPKTKQSESRRQVFATFLKSLLTQLEKYVRDTNLTQIKRIRKQIGPPVSNPRSDSKVTARVFTGDVAKDIQLVNEELQAYDRQRDAIGQLVQEIDLLASFTSSLDAVVKGLFQTTSTADVSSQPLGPMGGPFVSLIKAQTSGYSQRLEKLIDRRVSLNAQLLVLQEKMKLIRSGSKFLTNEPIALISIVDTLLYLFTQVTYTCKQCKHYSVTPLEEQEFVTEGLTREEVEAERTRLQRARARAENIREALRRGDESGFCIYRAANLPTIENGSCLSVWGLSNNDYWTASDNDEDGREDIVSKVKERLDPRNR